MPPSSPLFAPPAGFDDWQAWVARFAELLQAPPDVPVVAGRASRPGHCMIFSPHPDDECIIGALPLRLRQEADWRVTNVAVTLGSKLERREPRWRELEAACEVLGFDNIRPAEQGLAQVRPETEVESPQLWLAHVRCIAELLEEFKPQLVLCPHAGDGNPTHLGVRKLLGQALAAARSSCVMAETEFWATMAEPNWMVQTTVADTARLVEALACHHGEIARNPYHLRLPAWLADSVRRGGELIAGAGSEVPHYAFATLYRLSRWQQGRQLQDLTPRLCPAAEALDSRWLAS